LAEPELIKRYHSNAIQLPEKQPGFDAVEGGTKSEHLTFETKKGVRTAVVEQTISGGNWISIKRIEKATPKNITANVEKALERADNALAKRVKPRLSKEPMESTNVHWRVLQGDPPDKITVHLHLADAPVTPELLAAAKEAVMNSGYTPDLPPIVIVMTGK
jgi:hypothetical protein